MDLWVGKTHASLPTLHFTALPVFFMKKDCEGTAGLWHSMNCCALQCFLGGTWGSSSLRSMVRLPAFMFLQPVGLGLPSFWRFPSCKGCHFGWKRDQDFFLEFFYGNAAAQMPLFHYHQQKPQSSPHSRVLLPFSCLRFCLGTMACST